MAPEILASIISAAGAVTGAGINATAAGIKNAKQWKYWQKQHAINLQDWNMMNQYNSPLAQMRRYEKAGLNPNLIYGQQNTTSELNSPPAPQYESPMTALGEGFTNAINAAQSRYVQMRQLQNQEEMNDALVKLYASKEELNREQTALTNQKTALENMKRIAYGAKDYYGKQGDILDMKLRSGEQYIKKLIVDTNIASLQKDFYEKTLQNRILQSSLLSTQMSLRNTNLRWQNKYMKVHTNREYWGLKADAQLLPHRVALEKSYGLEMAAQKLRALRMQNNFNQQNFPLMLQKGVAGNFFLEQQALREALGLELDMYEFDRKQGESRFRNFNAFGNALYNYKKVLFR